MDKELLMKIIMDDDQGLLSLEEHQYYNKFDQAIDTVKFLEKSIYKFSYNTPEEYSKVFQKCEELITSIRRLSDLHYFETLKNNY